MPTGRSSVDFSWFPDASWWETLHTLAYRPIRYVHSSHLKHVADLVVLRALDDSPKSRTKANAWVSQELKLDAVDWQFDSVAERLLFLSPDLRLRILRFSAMRTIAPLVRHFVKKSDRQAAIAFLGQADYDWMLRRAERHPVLALPERLPSADFVQQFTFVHRALWSVIYHQLSPVLARRLYLQFTTQEANPVAEFDGCELDRTSVDALIVSIITREMDPALSHAFN